MTAAITPIASILETYLMGTGSAQAVFNRQSSRGAGGGVPEGPLEDGVQQGVSGVQQQAEAGA